MTGFLCLGGFWRLSGTTRSAGGVPATSRALRRASFAAVNFLGLFFFGNQPSFFVTSFPCRCSLLWGNKVYGMGPNKLNMRMLSTTTVIHT